MKKAMIAIMALGLTVATTNCFAQANMKNYKDKYKARKELMKMDKDFNDEKASKDARKQAKSMEKEGWIVAPGALPLAKQIDRSLLFQNQTEDDLLTPKYVWGDATSTAENYDAGKMQALELARINLIGSIETSITKIVDSNTSNKQLNAGDAASVISTLGKVKSIVSQKLGQTIPVIDTYRTLKNGNVEVRIMTFYSMDTAREITKEAIRKQLEKEGNKLGENLDEYMGK